MKRLLAYLLITTLSVSLAACGDKQGDVPTSTLDPNSEISVPNTHSNPNEETVSASYDLDAIKEEAGTVFSSFISVANQIEDNTDFDTVRSYYETMEDIHANWYVQYCNGTEEEFKELTTFEQFLLYELYINPVKYTYSGAYDTYFSDLARFQATVTTTCYDLLKRGTGDVGKEVADAYQEIMAWQYNLFTEYGIMYNFMTDGTSAE